MVVFDFPLNNRHEEPTAGFHQSAAENNRFRVDKVSNRTADATDNDSRLCNDSRNQRVFAL